MWSLKSESCRIVYGGGSTWRVNRVYFLGLGLKLPNNSTWFKVSYYQTTGLYSISGGTKIGYEVDELRVH